MRIYIAGKITGLDEKQTRHKFEKAEALIHASNHEAINPMKHVKGTDVTPKEAMKVCLPLLWNCDAIYLLDDHIWSEGAKVELAVARYIGLHILDVDDLN
jgi:hypothetical protein